MRYVRPLIYCALLTPLLVGCQTPLKALAKGATGQLEAPQVPNRESDTDSGVQTASAIQPAQTETEDANPAVKQFLSDLKAINQKSQAAQQDLVAQLKTHAAPSKPEAKPLLTEPTREEALQQVMGDLVAIGQQSPAAQQRLLSHLQTAKPVHWEALAQRAKSDLQYHNHLKSGKKSSQAKPDATKHHDHPAGRTMTLKTPVGRSVSPAMPSGKPSPDLPATQPSTPANPSKEPKDQRRFDPSVRQTSASSPAAMVFPGASSDGQEAEPYTITPRTAPESMATNGQPLRMPGASSSEWEESLRETIQQLQEQVKTHPQTVEEAYDHVRLRMLQLVAGDLDAAAGATPGLTANQQKYWSHQLLANSTMLDYKSQPEARRRAAAAGLHLDNATSALQQLGSLTVRNVTFCKEVFGFGAYEALDATKFVPGQKVNVYAEVENFKTLPTQQGEHTSLATSYQVLDQHGGRVAGGEVPIVNDYCARRRRDFHIQYGLTLPERVYPGTYVLELTLTDQLGDKIGHGSIQFEIVEQGARAKVER